MYSKAFKNLHYFRPKKKTYITDYSDCALLAVVHIPKQKLSAPTVPILILSNGGIFLLPSKLDENYELAFQHRCELRKQVVEHMKDWQQRKKPPICCMIGVQTWYRKVWWPNELRYCAIPKTVRRPSSRSVKMNLRISRPNNAQACLLHHLVIQKGIS